MSIEEKLRKAFSKKKEIVTEAIKSKYHPHMDPNLYELDTFLIKSGYSLIDVIEMEKDKPELMIEANTRNLKEEYFYPDINHDWREGKFYITVKDYGELDTQEVGWIIQGYQNAIAVVKHLESLDLTKLEYEREEEEDSEE